jgi:hypothetical protein
VVELKVIEESMEGSVKRSVKNSVKALRGGFEFAHPLG